MAESTPSAKSGTSALEILQRPNPVLSGEHDYDLRINNRNRDVLDKITAFKPWTDLNFRAISLAYGDILCRDIKELYPRYRRIYTIEDEHDKTITDIRDLDLLGLGWTYQVVRAPANGAAAILRPRFSAPDAESEPPILLFGRHSLWWQHALDPELTVKPGALIVDSTGPSTAMKYNYDHADELKKDPTYAVGIHEVAERWKSEWLARDSDDLKVALEVPSRCSGAPSIDITRARLIPLEKIATYCRFGQTRYAYVLTQTELVALRVRRVPPPGNETKPHAAIEYVSVPWEAEAGLTVSLTLWTLACMAVNDEHRGMESDEGEPLGAMARLTWWKFVEADGVYESIISKRRIPVAEWKQEEYGEFVQLTEEEGNNYTKDLVLLDEAHCPNRFSGVIRNLPFRPGATDPRPYGTNQPPSKGIVPSRGAPTEASRAPGPSRVREAIIHWEEPIGDSPCTLFYSPREKGWQVAIDGNVLPVKRDAKTRRHFVVVNGTVRDVKML